MINFKRNYLSIALLLPFVFSSCTKDDMPAPTVVNSKVFVLGTVELLEFLELPPL
jgi:hypothetical protein